MNIEDVDKNILSKIPDMVYKIIDDSINRASFLRQWQLLSTVRAYESGKYDWIIALIQNLFTSIDMFRGYEQFVGTTMFETTTQVSIEPLPFPGGLGMNLYITGMDDLATKNLRSVQFGGELKIGDQLRIIDKNTGIEEPDIQRAAHRMSDFFIEKFSRLMTEAAK